MCFLNMYEMCFFLRFLIGKFVCVYFRLLCQQLEQPVLPCCSCHITDFTISDMLLSIAIFGE